MMAYPKRLRTSSNDDQDDEEAEGEEKVIQSKRSRTLQIQSFLNTEKNSSSDSASSSDDQIESQTSEDTPFVIESSIDLKLAYKAHHKRGYLMPKYATTPKSSVASICNKVIVSIVTVWQKYSIQSNFANNFQKMLRCHFSVEFPGPTHIDDSIGIFLLLRSDFCQSTVDSFVYLLATKNLRYGSSPIFAALDHILFNGSPSVTSFLMLRRIFHHIIFPPLLSSLECPHLNSSLHSWLSTSLKGASTEIRSRFFHFTLDQYFSQAPSLSTSAFQGSIQRLLASSDLTLRDDFIRALILHSRYSELILTFWKVLLGYFSEYPCVSICHIIFSSFDANNAAFSSDRLRFLFSFMYYMCVSPNWFDLHFLPLILDAVENHHPLRSTCLEILEHAYSSELLLDMESLASGRGFQATSSPLLPLDITAFIRSVLHRSPNHQSTFIDLLSKVISQSPPDKLIHCQWPRLLKIFSFLDSSSVAHKQISSKLFSSYLRLRFSPQFPPSHPDEIFEYFLLHSGCFDQPHLFQLLLQSFNLPNSDPSLSLAFSKTFCSIHIFNPKPDIVLASILSHLTLSSCSLLFFNSYFLQAVQTLFALLEHRDHIHISLLSLQLLDLIFGHATNPPNSHFNSHFSEIKAYMPSLFDLLEHPHSSIRSLSSNILSVFK